MQNYQTVLKGCYFYKGIHLFCFVSFFLNIVLALWGSTCDKGESELPPVSLLSLRLLYFPEMYVSVGFLFGFVF